MKTMTLLQAAVLLLLAVIGAYAGQDSGKPTCTTTEAAVETCDL